ncbi:hypothetical protein LCGC14_0456770 [marine sediment metagenome]|uniref:Uncharacterized protein n=1 Tax=marine sediment metagenome TaxID=412755 RepID=A0A0F9SG95_9ZZZZ
MDSENENTSKWILLREKIENLGTLKRTDGALFVQEVLKFLLETHRCNPENEE